MEAYHRKLEQTKKEVQEIRALEAELKWGMEREERKEVDEDIINIWESYEKI